MRIAMLSGSVSRRAGGIFDAVAGLSTALTGNGNRVTVLGLEDEFTAEDKGSWGAVDLITTRSLPPYSFGYAPKLSGFLKKITPDLIHCHGLWMYPSTLTRSFGVRHQLPYLISPHGMLDEWALRHGAMKKRVAYWASEGANLRRASCIHALCEAEALSIRRLGLHAPICIIPNGISARMPATQLRPKWRTPAMQNRKILLYLGRLHPKKGLSMLLKAWKLAAMEKDWHLVIAGWEQEDYLSVLKREVEELAVGNSVSIIGPQFGDEKSACFSNADAFVLPSFSEGVPMVVLEAWQHSLPVLMTTACNLPQGERAGAAIAVHAELSHLASGLSRLLNRSDKDRGEMGQAGVKLVQDVFEWKRVSESMSAVYRWLVQDGQRPACVHLD